MRVLLGAPFHRAQRWRRVSSALERTLRDRDHAYFSSACRHELHAECALSELTCKWCESRCLCRCHKQ